MHPELLNNSLFLRYYNQWQQDPTSIVFVPIAEFFLSYQLIDEAIRICLAGLREHPDLVSGRLTLAKAYFRKKEYSNARAELQRVLKLVPSQEKALELFELVEQVSRVTTKAPLRPETPRDLPRPPEQPQPSDPRWATLTMAKIYAAQGHFSQAREVYQTLLQHDPNNEEAKEGLASLDPRTTG